MELILILTHTNYNNVKKRLEIPALALNEAKHETAQSLDLLECCGVVHVKGKRFRHLAEIIIVQRKSRYDRR